MCDSSALIVKNTFFCIAEEPSPSIQTRARAKTAGAPTALADWASEVDADGDTSEGVSDSNSSFGFTFDEEDSSQLVQCIVKNTFICVREEHSPTQPQRARAQTAHAVTSWEEEMEEKLGDDNDDGEAPMLHVATNWCFGQKFDGQVCHSPQTSDASSPVLDFDDEQSCQRAQSIFETGVAADRQEIIAALRGRVREAAKLPHAHKVLEAVLLYTGTDEAAFVADELLGHGEGLLDALTCSVICRLLEHSPSDVRTVKLMDELLSGDVPALCCHKSGHLVAAAIISSGIPRQAGQVVRALHCNPQRFARHRFASKVVEVALRSWVVVGSDSLACELIAQPGTVVNLACHNFGVHVVRALLASPMYSAQVMHFLMKTLRRLLKDKYGRELMLEMGVVPDM